MRRIGDEPLTGTQRARRSREKQAAEYQRHRAALHAILQSETIAEAREAACIALLKDPVSEDVT